MTDPHHFPILDGRDRNPDFNPFPFMSHSQSPARPNGHRELQMQIPLSVSPLPTHPPSTLPILGSPLQPKIRPESPPIPSSDGITREDDGAADGQHDDSQGPAKKRRRSRKGLGKRFVCQCGRGYSRAEHLSRHQLNHKPKEIYYCDFPNCERSFVRADLCERHKQRHRRGNQEPSQSLPPLNRPTDFNPVDQHVGGLEKNGMSHGGPMTNDMETSPSPQAALPSSSQTTQHPVSFANSSFSPPTDSRNYQYGLAAPPTLPAIMVPQPSPGLRSDQVPIPGFQPGAPAYPTQFHHGHRPDGPVPIPGPNPTGQRPSVSYDTTNGPSMYGLDPFGQPGRSPPQSVPDDFTAWLLCGEAQRGAAAGVISAASLGFQAPFFAHDVAAATAATAEPDPECMVTPRQGPAAIMLADLAQQSARTISPEQDLLTEARRQDIIDVLQGSSFDGDIDIHFGGTKDDGSVLSTGMMQRYIAAYWEYMQPQMPILHRPTFDVNSCPILLLLAVLMMGASCMEKRYGLEVTTQCAALSKYIARGLRWCLFRSPDFGPPVKLWVLQTLLLLEVYEKMLSSRELHERAHVHHATTLTLMRRGSSLEGESKDVTKDDEMKAGDGVDPAEARWLSWIDTEATRRVGLAAFVTDALHASMFGHVAALAAHELRLPLPCDEDLWSARSWTEAAHVEARLRSTDQCRPVYFLDGLRSILAQQPVRATGFGRVALMAGLLSVGWQLQQRDLQARSLGSSGLSTGAAAARWRNAVIRGVDFWHHDFERALLAPNAAAVMAGGFSLTSARSASVPITFLADADTRAVLYCLAQITTHADFVDCQILAGATRLLGRKVTPAHYSACKERIADWAPTVHARAAAMSALTFLAETLVLTTAMPLAGPPTPSSGMSVSSAGGRRRYYAARDDPHIHRPWSVYVATLIVWAYGFATDGSIDDQESAVRRYHALIDDPDAAFSDMHDLFTRTGALSPAPAGAQRAASTAQLAVDEHTRLSRARQQHQQQHGSSASLPPLPPAPPTPPAPPHGSSEALAFIQNRNQTLGLLITVRTAIQTARWELMAEASRLLGRAISLSCGLSLTDVCQPALEGGTGPA